ncbi:MAG: C25 family cysteine peptidase [Bacteroidota bacterium]
MRARCLLWSVLFVLVSTSPLFAQLAPPPFDPGWYEAGQPYVKISVVDDGLYAVSGRELAAQGVDLATVDATTLRLLENGQDIPLALNGDADGRFDPDDQLLFVGQRNTGADEAWAFEPVLRSSTFYSLFSDTTVYWLTWGGAAGLRYAPGETAASGTPLTVERTRLHAEEDDPHYFGDGNEAIQPRYTRGEGFYWHVLNQAGTTDPVSQEITVPLEDLVFTADTLALTVRLSGASRSPHRVQLELLLRDGAEEAYQEVDVVSWNAYQFADLSATVRQDALPANGTLQMRVTSFNDQRALANQVLIDWVEASYVRALRVPQGTGRLVQRSATQPLALSAPAGTTLLALDPVAQTRYDVTADAQGQALVPAAAAAAPLWVTAAPRRPVALTRAQPVDWADPTRAADYVLLTTPALRGAAEAWAAYREDTGHRVAIVMQQDVFDVFDYGRPTPLAIRRFVHQTQQWSTPPRFLMLIGDLVRPISGQPRRALQPWEVVSYGYAPSDSWLAMGLEGPDDWTEVLAVGRLPVRTNAQSQIYLDKVVRYEATPIEDWQKRVLQLVGGLNPSEQAVLQSYVEEWGQVVAANPAAMDTVQFFKNTAEVLDPTLQDSLRLSIREGASWLTYFGHSAADTWEIVVDQPEDFDNAERLPVVLSLGCNTGNVAGGRNEIVDVLVLGERLIYGSPNGAIAHWGSSSFSSIGLPGQMTRYVHEVAFRDTVRTLGLVFQEAKRRFATERTITVGAQVALLQYGLLGDPALRINLPTQPDLILRPEDLRVQPEAPLPADSALTLTLRLRNRGLVPADSVLLRVDHQPPDQPTRTYNQTLPPVRIDTTVTLRVPIGEADVGRNQLRVSVDPLDVLPEEDELNNTIERETLVFSSGVTVLAPLDRGLVIGSSAELQVVTAAIGGQAIPAVVFELDTTATFSTPGRATHRAVPERQVATWPVTQLEPGQTYFWRARVEGSAAETWQAAAFTVLPSASGRGWAQQGPLFADNQSDGILLWEDGAWSVNTFSLKVTASSERGSGLLKGQFQVGSDIYQRLGLGFGVLVLNGQTGEVEAHDSFPTYKISPDLEARFDDDSTRARIRLDSLIQTIDEGDYVFARTRHLGRQSGTEIPPPVKRMLRTLGSTAIDTLDYTDLWLLAGRFGRPETIVERVVPAGGTNESILDTTLAFQFQGGRTTTPRIGPALRWQDLDGVIRGASPAGEALVEVLDESGQDVLLTQTLPGRVDLTAIEAAIHPYLRLRTTLRDTTRAAVPQLETLVVTFDPVPELALSAEALVLSADTLLEAAPLEVETTVFNLSADPVAQAVVQYRIRDAENREEVVAVDTLAALPPQGSLRSQVVLPTAGRVGQNRLLVAVDQGGPAEPVVFNNVVQRPFQIEADATPPSFLVQIDGEALPNDPLPISGRNLQDPAFPFISARPQIEVLVEDDNRFRVLDDTTLVEVRLAGLVQTVGSPDVAYTPASAPGEAARLLFTPDLSERDTTYTLQVRAFDASGNEAQDSPYQLHFRVQQEVEVESLYPYPNPMVESTRLAFRLRGADATEIDDFRIRLYTLTGRLVRELDLMDEPQLLTAPPLRIGWNQAVWDGRDADGDRVATGVYLYKVFARTGGTSLRVNDDRVEKVVVIR